MHRRRVLASIPLLFGGAGCLGGGTCPPFETGADRSVCYRSQRGEPIWLSVSQSNWNISKSANPAAPNVFTLHNASATSLRVTPHGWTLYENDSEQWMPVKRGTKDDGDVFLTPSGTYRWSLSRETHPSPTEKHTEYITADIDRGRYAFVVQVPDPHTDKSIACLAAFSVVGAVQNTVERAERNEGW
jgi:hypothetical protein